MYKTIFALCVLLLFAACSDGTTTVTVRHDVVTNPGIAERHADAPNQVGMPTAAWVRLRDRNDIETELWSRYGIQSVCKGFIETYCVWGGYPYGASYLTFEKLGLAGVDHGIVIIADIAYLSTERFRSYRPYSRPKRPHRRYRHKKHRPHY